MTCKFYDEMMADLVGIYEQPVGKKEFATHKVKGPSAPTWEAN
jgi:hypothetical protein